MAFKPTDVMPHVTMICVGNRKDGLHGKAPVTSQGATACEPGIGLVAQPRPSIQPNSLRQSWTTYFLNLVE